MHKQTHDMHAHIVTYTCLNCVMCIIVLIGQYISGNLLLCKAEKPSVCLRHGIILVVGLGDSIDSIHNRDSALLSSNAIVAELSIRIAHVIHTHA